jgi:repressor LexA
VHLHTVKPTPQQAAILEFIGSFREQTGSLPSQREIQEHFGFASRHSVPKHLAALQRKGLLERSAGRARAMAPVAEFSSGSLLRVPLLGAIPAGLPIDQVEQSGDFLQVDAATLGLSRQAEVFGLRVRGDSMIDAHIVDGDLAILERKPASHRDIVAALIDGEVTLKRLIVEGSRKFLKAENANYADLMPALELVIQGVLRTVIRTHPARL